MQQRMIEGYLKFRKLLVMALSLFSSFNEPKFDAKYLFEHWEFIILEGNI